MLPAEVSFKLTFRGEKLTLLYCVVFCGFLTNVPHGTFVNVQKKNVVKSGLKPGKQFLNTNLLI